jgi:hypothetical protein
VNRGRAVSVLGGLAIATGLLGASAASAATLLGDYQFQGTRTSSGPGPVALDIGGGGNSFQNDNVFGTSRQVLRFPEGSGLQMSAVGVGTASYSVVTTFRFDDVDGYRRILNPHNDSNFDRGLYELDGLAAIYPDGPEVDSTQVLFAPDNYATVVMTSEPPTRTKVYVNGNLAAQAEETIDVDDDTLRFFKDNGTDTEQSAGAVSCIRVFSGVLSDSEVGGIGASATCGATAAAATPPPATTTKKKCKKHKKKHRAAESKKKCKKKKKKH